MIGLPVTTRRVIHRDRTLTIRRVGDRVAVSVIVVRLGRMS